MTVSIIVSETMNGAAFSDALAGGSIGIDWGQASNGGYTPLISQAANTGKKSMWIKHDAVVDPITDCKLFIQQYSGTYGGADTAANDFTTYKNKGYASASSNANNIDGLYSGLVVEMDYAVSTASQFDPARVGTQAFIFGDGVGSPQDGIDLTSAFPLKTIAMVYDNAGTPVVATTPVEGKIGKSGDAVLGDNAAMYWRFFLEAAAVTGGIMQVDVVIAYSFTA